jgi:hypothetical protein
MPEAKHSTIRAFADPLQTRGPNKSTSSCQRTLGNSQPLSSNFLTSASKFGGNSLGTA